MTSSRLGRFRSTTRPAVSALATLLLLGSSAGWANPIPMDPADACNLCPEGSDAWVAADTFPAKFPNGPQAPCDCPDGSVFVTIHNASGAPIDGGCYGGAPDFPVPNPGGPLVKGACPDGMLTIDIFGDSFCTPDCSTFGMTLNPEGTACISSCQYGTVQDVYLILTGDLDYPGPAGVDFPAGTYKLTRGPWGYYHNVTASIEGDKNGASFYLCGEWNNCWDSGPFGGASFNNAIVGKMTPISTWSVPAGSIFLSCTP
jgi:hypothetical protein